MNTKLKKLHYPIGLISLIFLPIFCCIFLFKKHAFDKIHVIAYNEFDKNIVKKNHAYLNRNFKQYEISGNDNFDKQTLQHIQNETHNLAISKQSEYGIKIQFSNKSKFWTLVKAVEICSIEKVVLYKPNQNEIFILKPKQNEIKKQLFLCGTWKCFLYNKTKDELEKERIAFFNKIIELTKKYFIILLSFIIITILSIKQLIFLNSK